VPKPTRIGALFNALFGCSVVEMLFRLVLALILSLGLSILFAWGWYHSDPVPDPLAQHAAGPLIPNR
jgi:energy-converting hydrogenase Eha subunit F